jgi:4-hydroxy 2-oxovalerate aldolase
VNNLSPYAVYIVDTQGAMFKDDFRRLYYQFDKYLNKTISIGFHSHNNMQLSYSIAVDFIEISRCRDIIIDASIYGMGRGAGNLNTELLAAYINKKIDNRYDISIILDLIDKYYYSLYKKNEWGYSLIHFLSASLECHPNYASFLLNKKHLSINEIGEILSQIPNEKSFEFNKILLEDLYFKFNL